MDIWSLAIAHWFAVAAPQPATTGAIVLRLTLAVFLIVLGAVVLEVASAASTAPG